MHKAAAPARRDALGGGGGQRGKRRHRKQRQALPACAAPLRANRALATLLPAIAPCCPVHAGAPALPGSAKDPVRPPPGSAAQRWAARPPRKGSAPGRHGRSLHGAAGARASGFRAGQLPNTDLYPALTHPPGPARPPTSHPRRLGPGGRAARSAPPPAPHSTQRSPGCVRPPPPPPPPPHTPTHPPTHTPHTGDQRV